MVGRGLWGPQGCHQGGGGGKGGGGWGGFKRSANMAANQTGNGASATDGGSHAAHGFGEPIRQKRSRSVFKLRSDGWRRFQAGVT